MNTSSILQALNNPITWFFLVGLGFLFWKVPTWKAGIEYRLSGVEKSVNELSRKADEIYSVLINKFGRAVDQAGSPVTLTQYGKDLFSQIDAEKIVNKYADKLLEETESMNAYQIQEYCFDFSRKDLLNDLEQHDKESFNKISTVASEEGIDLEKLTRVIGISLRDRVLSTQGKSPMEVDDHSPPTEKK